MDGWMENIDIVGTAGNFVGGLGGYGQGGKGQVGRLRDFQKRAFRGRRKSPSGSE